jgi:hypothetical protein
VANGELLRAYLPFFLSPFPQLISFPWIFPVLSPSQGVKFLPPGLHLFIFSAAPSSTSQRPNPDTSVASGVGVRNGILRFYRQGETIVEEWDNGREELKRMGGKKSSKRRRTVGKGEGREETVLSEEYLKSLDASLAPYPQEEIATEWASLTGFVTEGTLARVVGLDEKASAMVDALMGSSMDEVAPGPDGNSGRRTWGKERTEEENEEVEEEGENKISEILDEEEEDAAGVLEGEELLLFVKFDEKRSWPKGAVGEELSRWSKDKSWLLSEVVKTQLNDGAFPFSLSLYRPLLSLTPFPPPRPARTPRRTSALLRPFLAPSQLLLPHRLQIALLPPLPLDLSRPPAFFSPLLDASFLRRPLDRLPTSLRILPHPLRLSSVLPRLDLLQHPPPLP